MVDFDQSAGMTDPGGQPGGRQQQDLLQHQNLPQQHDAPQPHDMPQQQDLPDGAEPAGCDTPDGGDATASAADAAAFENALRTALATQVEMAVRHRLLTNNLMQAQHSHGDEFEAAYRQLLQTATPELVQNILSRDDPGESIVQWYRRARLLSEAPEGDIDAWVRQRYAELTAGAAPGGQSLPPPSLVGARGAGRPLSEKVPGSAFSYAFGP